MMKKFIILTQDGLTLTKRNTNIENLQVLDILEGISAESALINFKKNYGKSLQGDFEDVIIFELSSENPLYFYLGNE